MRYFPNPYQDYQIGSPFQIDSQLWLTKAQEVAKLIFNHKKHAESNLDGGLYVGPSGIAYALWKLSTFLESSPTDSKPILEYAQHLMKLNLQYTQKPERQRDKKNKFGFLLGIVDILTRKDIFFRKFFLSNFFRRIWSICSCSSYISFRREPS